MDKDNGHINQKWKVVYLKDMKKQQTKGLNNRWGFHINRPFYIVSRMPARRVIEVVRGRNLVIRTKNNKATQQFYFDQKSKTVMSVAYKGKVLDIAKGGKSNNMQIWSLNSRWF